MSERPTPEERMVWIDTKLAEITEESHSSYVHGCVAAVRDMLDDCRIVHPDDVPEDDPETRGWPDRWDAHDHNSGWNACRAHIFGEGA